MKKFFVAVLLLFLLPLSACSSNAKTKMESNEWTDVQSFSCHLVSASSSNNFKVKEFSVFSWYKLETNNEEITREEYYSVETLPTFPISITGEIPEYKSELLDKLSDCKNWKFYYTDQNSENTKYIKSSCTGYKFYYVQVKFFDDGSLGIKYYENEKEIYSRLSPLTYQITYFSE